MSKSVVEHEGRYWHVPKAGLWPLAGLLVSSVLAWLNFGLLDWSWLYQEVASVFTFSDIVIVYPFVAEYLFVVGVFVSLAALFKGGYGCLKPFGECGLAGGLATGLVFGLSAGLPAGLIFGLAIGLAFGLAVALIFGLIFGLAIGLAFASVWEFE